MLLFENTAKVHVRMTLINPKNQTIIGCKIIFPIPLIRLEFPMKIQPT